MALSQYRLFTRATIAPRPTFATRTFYVATPLNANLRETVSKGIDQAAETIVRAETVVEDTLNKGIKKTEKAGKHGLKDAEELKNEVKDDVSSSNTFTEAIGKVASDVKNMASKVVGMGTTEAAKQTASNAKAGAADMKEKAKDKVKDMAYDAAKSGIKNKASEKIEDMKDTAQSAAEKMGVNTEKVKQAASETMEQAKDIGKKVVDSVSGAFESVTKSMGAGTTIKANPNISKKTKKEIIENFEGPKSSPQDISATTLFERGVDMRKVIEDDMGLGGKSPEKIGVMSPEDAIKAYEAYISEDESQLNPEARTPKYNQSFIDNTPGNKSIDEVGRSSEYQPGRIAEDNLPDYANRRGIDSSSEQEINRRNEGIIGDLGSIDKNNKQEKPIKI